MAIQRTSWLSCNIWFSTTSSSLQNISWQPFWHISSVPRKKGNGQKYGDEGQPTAVANRLKKCLMCYSYKFKLKTEQKRHVRMFHSRANSTYKEPDFECLVCKKQFTSLASLNWHKTKEGHNAHKTAALVGSSELPKKLWRKTKQRTINKMLSQHQSQVDLENDIDSNKEMLCSAANCRIKFLDIVVINWVSCESYVRWHHSVCIDLADKSESQLSEMNYVCNKCNWNYNQNRITTSFCELLFLLFLKWGNKVYIGFIEQKLFHFQILQQLLNIL